MAVLSAPRAGRGLAAPCWTPSGSVCYRRRSGPCAGRLKLMSGFSPRSSRTCPGEPATSSSRPIRHEIGLTAEEWPGRVVGVVEIERSGDRITVRGTIGAAAWLECVRCLKGFERTLSVPFDVFSNVPAGSRQRIEEELERGNYMKFHDGRRLALGDDAREALLLELPMAPRCREDCAGLCPRCGAGARQRAVWMRPPGRTRLRVHAHPRGGCFNGSSQATTLQHARPQAPHALEAHGSCAAVVQPLQHPKRPHRICPHCGFYNREEIVPPRAD